MLKQSASKCQATLKQTTSKRQATIKQMGSNPILPYSQTPITPDSQTPLHSSDGRRAPSKRRRKADDPFGWNESEGWVGITDDDHAKWLELFPAVDSRIELKRLDQWLRDNPTKAHKSHWRRWVNKIFGIKQDKGGTRGGSASKPQVSRNQAADKPQTREQYRPFNAPEDCDPSDYHRFRTPDGRACSPSIYRTKDGRRRFITGEWYDDVMAGKPAQQPERSEHEVALFGKDSPRRGSQADIA